jgi:hypothetical protein
MAVTTATLAAAIPTFAGRPATMAAVTTAPMTFPVFSESKHDVCLSRFHAAKIYL